MKFTLFSTPYREFSTHRYLIKTTEEFYEKLRFYNGRCDCYCSIYAYSHLRENGYRPDYSSAFIDKIFFDFDKCDFLPYTKAELKAFGMSKDEKDKEKYKHIYEIEQHEPENEERLMDAVRRMRNYIQRKNLLANWSMSGNGMHSYIFTDGRQPQFKKNAINNCHVHIARKLDLKVDTTSFSDIAQISRVQNSLSYKLLLKKTKRYCIPLKEDELDLSLRNIYKIAEKPRNMNGFNDGIKLINLARFDIPKTDYYEIYGESEDFGEIEEDISMEFEHLAPCIQQLLSISDLEYDLRSQLIIALRDEGFSAGEVRGILSKTLNQVFWNHAHRKERNVANIFRRPQYMVKSCEFWQRIGICNRNEEPFSECKREHPVYL